MKATITAACFATVCAIAAGPIANAQTQGQGQSTQQTTPRTDTQQQTITLNGCLERDSAAVGGAVSGAAGTGSSTATAQSNRAGEQGASALFKLTDATIVPSTGASTTGQQQSQIDKDKEKDYRLIASSSSVDLSQHLNHQVEVTGTLSKDNDRMTGTGTSTTGRTGTGSTTGSTTGQTGMGQGTTGQRTMGQSDKDQPELFRVTSVRMVANTCR